MDKQSLILAHLEIPKILAIKLAPGEPDVVDELIAEGNLALCEAAEKFDPGRGVTFATYASRSVWNAQIRAKRFMTSVVDVPLYMDLAPDASFSEDDDYDFD
jgi:DNA-directed RNA polymerase specialized sigma subunit